MKKNLFILAVAGLALASCSSDETIASQATSQANEISFRAFNNGMTRAADAHFNVANDQFKVTAFPQGTTTTAYFSNVIFKTADGSTFTSTGGKYYWPNSTNLDFYAWAPAGQSDNYASIPVTVASEAASQIDLVYGKTLDWGKVALQTGTDAGHRIDGSSVQGVTINFRHAESKVVIKLQNSNSNLKITASNVTIGNVSGSGTFAIAETHTDTKDAATIAGGWSSLGAATASYSQDITPAVFSTATQAGVDMILIPQTLTNAGVYNKTGSAAVGDPFNGAYITVKLKIQNSADDNYIVGKASGVDEYVTALFPLPATAWAPGKKYTYTVDLAGGGYYPTNHDTNEDLDPILEGAEIKFVTVTVDNWTPYDGDGNGSADADGDSDTNNDPINVGM